ncbi:ileS, partial [Symbiodinium sp. CCMP2456]
LITKPAPRVHEVPEKGTSATLAASATVLAVCAASRRRPAEPRAAVLVRVQATEKKEKKKQKGGGDDSVYKDSVMLPSTDFSQRANAKTREPEIQEFWKKERIYEKLQ